MATTESEATGELLLTKPVIPECAKSCDLFLKELVLREHFEEISTKLKKENEFYRNAIKSVLNGIKKMITPNHAVMNFLRTELKDELEILNAYFFVRDDVINVWVIIKNENLDVERMTAEVLGKMFSIFEDIKFDFMIIPIQGLKKEDILPLDSKKIF